MIGLKTLWNRLETSPYFQAMACVLYIDHTLITPIFAEGVGYQTAGLFTAIAALIIKLVIMSAISMGIAYLMAKKPPKPNHAKPIGLEQFDVPTAEEGRPIQVLFGTRYITGPNVVWYGDYVAEAIIVRM